MDTSLPGLFQGLSPDHLEWAMRRFQPASVSVGARLIEEGEEDPSLIVVRSGRLEISTGGVVLATATPGDLVGEVGLFSSGVRTATVEALTQADLLVLDRVGYVELRNASSPVAHALEEHTLSLLTRRLSSTSRRIAELAEGTPAAHVLPPQGFFARVAALLGAGGRGTGPRGLDKAAVLARVPLFADAPDDALAELADAFETDSFGAGAFLCTEGALGAELFVIAEGEVEVVVATEDDRVEPLACLEAGDALGMCALIERQPRLASCIARGRVVTLSLDATAWHDLANRADVVGSVLRTAMIRALSEQLAYANAQLSQLDLTRHLEQLKAGRAATGSFGAAGALDPVLRASAGLEAHGRHIGGR